jgi:hypothetical protein
MRRLALIAALTVAAAIPATAHAQNPRLGLGAPALQDTRCEDASYQDCQRHRYAYGPLTVTPGANRNLNEFGIQKPDVDGYITRMTANLYYKDGTIPRVDIVHLHHGVWASTRTIGNFIPFFAAGEEKTEFQLPTGYGMRIQANDTWILNHMLHNLTPQAKEVYVVWDVDYIPAASAEAQGMKQAAPIWLDVMINQRAAYPVFNIQQNFGARNAQTGQRECTYPRQRCATFDPYGKTQPGNGRGYEWTVPPQWAGTFIAMGGHVHPGGLRVQADLVRNEQARPMFTSEAVYFDKKGPISWDMAMTVTKPGWRAQVRAGDKVRINATYDTNHGSWYEGMGIMISYIAPGDTSGPDPFTTPIDTKGEVTHGHLAENDFHGGERMRALTRKAGKKVSKVSINNYTYGATDLTQLNRRGVPRVSFGGKLVFSNDESDSTLWHTVTTCKAPCTGVTGISYPLADGRPSLDSLNLGFSPQSPETEPAANIKSFTIRPKKDGLKVNKTYTYFCRVHPFMRGAFKVVK